MSDKAQNPPHVSLLTPQSPSGIAVISLSGPGSEAVLAHLFERKRRSRRKLPPPSTAAHGFLHHEGRLLDEVLLVNTGGECERFEVCCHGGSAAASAIMNALVDTGAKALPWSRLVEADTLDHDILVALLQSKGPSQAAVLAHLQSGCLKKAFQEVFQAMTGALHPLAPGEGADDPPDMQRALHLLERLEKSHDLGRFLENPPKVVMLGAPNAGKSTLFNAVLGEHRVLTSKIPGTTRDPVEALFLLEGFPVRLYDLPGVEAHPASTIQAQAMAEAERLIQEADLILGVVDANVVTIDDSWELPSFESSNPCIAKTRKRAISILNKTDLLDDEDKTLRRAGNLEKESNIVCLSALKDHGLERLFDKMSRILSLDILKRRFQPQLFNNKQLTMVVELRAVFEHRTWNPHIFQRLSGYLAGSADWIV